MEYCRQLKFEEDPNYKYLTDLFEKCLARHNLDNKIFDFTWKQNRLSKDKEALKNSVLNVIKKKAKPGEEGQQAEHVSEVLSLTIQKNLDSPMKQTIGRDQGYGGVGPNQGQFAKPAGQEMKAIAMAGTGIINGQQIPSGTQGKQYYGGAGAQGGNAYEQSRGTIPVNNHMGATNAGPNMAGNTALGMSAQKVTPPTDQYNSQNKRGSEFKKSAQHILNR